MKKNTGGFLRFYPYVLLIGGIIALFSATVLIVEKVRLLTNPTAQLGCDLNPVVACGPVINTWQASVFGFPNPVLGLIGFSVVAVIGGGILAGATFKRWFWLGLQAGVAFGIGLVFWLQYQSIFNIGALCPYCMVVWSMMIPIFWYTTLYNFYHGHIKTPKKLKKVLQFAYKHHADILIVWYLAIISVILHHFWYYWSTLI